MSEEGAAGVRPAALLAELSAAQQEYLAASDRRRQLVKHAMGLPASERPTVTAMAAAMGLPRMSLHQLSR